MPVVHSDGEMILKLWINQNWYIPVNREGYCAGTYYEGALGIVVQLISRDGKGTQALKLPRLMADTLKENAYINELLIQEERCVSSVFTDDRFDRRNLLTPQHNLNNILLKPISTQFAQKDARDLDHHLVAVQFKHGRPPRFCAVSMQTDDTQNHTLFPREIQDCPLREDKVFSHVVDAARSESEEWSRTVAVMPEANQPAIVFEINNAFLLDSCKDVWYVGLPCVAYLWGTSTMQEAIVLGKHADWSIRSRLLLISNVVSGLLSLHCRGLLHTDIRPSNIMFIGNVADPNSYYLIDYAAYNLLSAEERAERGEQGGKGRPLLGPTIGRERSSPFHAPERRWSLEKESGDVAVIVKDERDKLRIVVGWSRDLIQNGKVKKELKERLSSFVFEEADSDAVGMIGKLKTNEYDLLLPGDRLQLGDYIFGIEAVSVLEDRQILLCDKHHWQIYHGKIVVESTEDFPKNWISIPKVIEQRQWSASTDVFGIGALFLYIVFNNGRTGEADSIVSSDLAYYRMLGQLENIYYFRHIWPHLSNLCAQLCGHMESARSGDHEVRERPYQPIQMEESGIGFGAAGSTHTIDSFARHITAFLVSTVPETRYVLECVNSNHYYFIYCIFFVLLCLHKKSVLWDSMTTAVEQIEKEVSGKIHDGPLVRDLILPFCDNRIDPARSHGDMVSVPAGLAKKFLDSLVRIVDSGLFESSRMDSKEIVVPDEEVHPAVFREKYFDLQQKYSALAQLHESASDSLERMTSENSSVVQEINSLKEEKETLSQECKKLKEANDELSSGLNSLQQRHEHLNLRYKKTFTEKEDLEKEYKLLLQAPGYVPNSSEDLQQRYNELRMAFGVTCDAAVALSDMLTQVKERPMVGGYGRDVMKMVKETLDQIVRASCQRSS